MISHSGTVLLLLVAIVIVQCKALAIPAIHSNHEDTHTPQKRTSSPTTVNSNSLQCSLSEDSCDFYSHCIESHFHCGPLGFAQAYAEARCKAIDDLRHSDESCDSCISSGGLYSWAVQQDTCLKQKLVDLVENEYKSKNPNPPNCLDLERKGLDLMKECYVEQSSSFCSALAENPTAFAQDIAKIANRFRINSYYATRVERELRNLILSCGNSHSSIPDSVLSSIADSVLSVGIHTPRIVLCGFIGESSQSKIDIPKAVELISDEFNRPIEQFNFSGSDDQRRCIEDYHYPDDLTPTDNDQLIFVTWNHEPNDSLIYNLPTEARLGAPPHTAYIRIYPYEPSQSNIEVPPECGDGRRQAGELCDMGVWNIHSLEVPGCYFTCQPTMATECSTEQLERSECWSVSCGDGVRSSNEDCDDDNYISGDGCSQCKQDEHYTCTGDYNRTSVCTLNSATTAPTYPPATTSSPSRLHTSSVSSPSLPPLSPDSPTASAHHLGMHSPTVEGISSSATATTAHHWRTLALQCLVSVLLFVHLLTTR